MIKRILTILLITLAVLLVIALALVFGLPKTGAGKALIDDVTRPRIEDAVAQSLGSTIVYDKPRGDLPGELILENVVLTDERGDWASIERLDVKWNPLALLRGSIAVEHIIVSNAVLFQPPPTMSESEEETPKKNGDFSLPNIRVEKILLDTISLREPLLGERYDINLAGDLSANGQRIAAKLSFEAAGGSDLGALDVNFDGNVLRLQTDVMSKPGGLIAQLVGVEGAVWLTLEGNGALPAWSGQLDGEIGSYGAFGSRLQGDFKNFSTGRFVARVEPGPEISDDLRELIGDAANITVGISREGSVVTATIEELAIDAGRITGAASIDVDGPLAGETQLQADLNDMLLEDLGPLASQLASAPVEFAARVSPTGGDTRSATTTAFSGSLATALGDVSITDGLLRRSEDEATTARAALALRPNFSPNDGAMGTLLGTGSEIDTRVTLSLDEANQTLALSNLEAALGSTDSGRLVISGALDATLDDLTFTADVDTRADAQLLSTLAGVQGLEGPLRLQMNVSGTPDDLAVGLNGQVPPLVVADVAVGAGELSGEVLGLPARPRGTVQLDAADGSYNGMVSLASNDTVIELEQLAFSTDGLSADGQGRLDLTTGDAVLNATIDARNGTTLVTGQRVAGYLEANVDLDAEDNALTAMLKLENAASGDLALRTLTATANGPLDEITVNFDAADLDLATLFVPKASSAAMIRQDESATVIDLSALNVSVGQDVEDGDVISLQSQTQIRLGETISLAPTTINWLDGGMITASGDFSPTRWQGTLDLNDIPLPNGIGRLGATVRVNTDESDVATADVLLKGLPSEGDNGERSAQIRNQIVWDGTLARLNSTIGVLDGAEQSVGTATASVPLGLTRDSDGVLSVAFDENASLDGSLRLDTPASPLLAFAPALPLYADGKLTADVTLAGTVSMPTVAGNMVFEGTRIEDQVIGTTVRDLLAQSDFRYDGNTLAGNFSLRAADARGKANSVRVDAQLRPGSDPTDVMGSVVEARVDLSSATIARTADLTATLGADLELGGELRALSLTGPITLETINIAIPEGAPPSDANNGPAMDFTPVTVVRVDTDDAEAPPVPLAAAPAPPEDGIIDLDLTIRGNNRIFVRGRGLDSEWATDLAIGGTSAAPKLAGTLSTRRGTFKFAGRTFAITEGVVNFDRGTEINPRLNVQAEYEAGDVTAIVSVTGRAAAPSIDLTSDPALPEEDVMALVLFGKNPTELSAIEQLQFAAAIAQLSGTAPLGGGGRGGPSLRDRAGLDALNFGIDPETNAAQVEVGKYLTDDIYVSATQAAGQAGTEITVVYELTDLLTIESTLQPNGAQRASANFKKDY